jgi:hypothetical protein
MASELQISKEFCTYDIFFKFMYDHENFLLGFSLKM